MAARRRKTLVVCRACHEDIHQNLSRGLSPSGDRGIELYRAVDRTSVYT